jgi:hypothetical protein
MPFKSISCFFDGSRRISSNKKNILEWKVEKSEISNIGIGGRGWGGFRVEVVEVNCEGLMNR